MTRSPLRDAWRTLVPEPDSPHGPLPAVLIALTLVSGLVNSFSYLALDRVFVGNMTGNIIFIAFSLSGDREFSVPASVAALVAFLAGTVVAGQVSRRLVDPHRGKKLLVLASVQTGLMLAAFLFEQLAGHPYAGDGPFVLIGLTGLGMGVQAGLVHRLAVPDLPTLVMPTPLTGMSVDGWVGGGPGGKVGRRLVSVLSLAAGALLGALLTLGAHAGFALGAAVLVLVVITGTAIPLSRSPRAWTVPTTR
jgi:uncharacterized membrane protein YoaK (UPF0700 family)